MTDYQPLYTLLFNAATDAVQALDELDPDRAKEILIRAQQVAEELFIGE